jgi:transcriptional regulator with GAF, ATPase, and Fis domain/signal transduction histidine kinase
MVKPTAHTSDPKSDRRSDKSSNSSDRRSARDLSKQDLSQVLPAIWEAETIERSIQEALEAIRAEFGYTLLWAGLYDRFNHRLTTRGVLTSGPRRFSHTTLALHPGDLLEQVIVQQQPTVIADIREESRAGAWERIAQTFETQGTVILPIQRKGICFGLIILGSRRWGVEPGILENSTLLAINNALAEAIHQNALEVQRQQTKQPAKPLLTLLGALSALPGLDARLEVVADETQKFVGAPVSLYWLEPRGRHFWCRVGKAKGKATGNLPVSEMPGLYQSLCADEMIVLGELEGSLKASLATRLMQHLKIQSLMAAPIIYQDELQGFMTLEGTSPRIWSDAEKEYVKGVAQLIGLAMPMAEMDSALSQAKSDHLLSAGITRSIHSDRDWQHVLGLCIEQLAARIGTDQLIVLSTNAERGGFDLCYRTGVGLGRSEHWLPLDTVDEQMLQRAHSPVSVESLENELKFAAWLKHFQAIGAKSLLVSNCTPGHPPEGLIIVMDKAERRWSQAERQIVQALSNQIGLILHQWQLQRQSDQQAHLQESFQWGMRSLQRLSKIEALDQSATRHIAQILHVPLVAIIAWENGSAFAQASNVLIQNNSFHIDEKRQISVESDAVLNWAASTEGLLTLKLADLPTDSQPWITGPAGTQILALALRTAPEHAPNAVIVLADSAGRQWSDEQTNLLAVIVNQLAWCRRHLKLTGTMLANQEQLTQLNWYKQHQLEDLNQGFKACLQQINLQPSDARTQMLLQTMDTLAERVGYVSEHERWSLETRSQTMPLIGLLKRAMARANPLVQERQLWTKVHCESNLTIAGDISKIEFVLYELVAEACDRSPVGDRIDIWCRPLDDRWLEVSITDKGLIDSQLLQELAQGRPADLLSPSALHQPHNSHLWVCQSLMQQLGGEFTLSHMEDGRSLSRVMLPLAH